MSKIRGKDTKPEKIVMESLESHGLTFERHANDLPGRPDIVFRDKRLAVFIEGDFWHGWRFPLWKHKLSLKWQQKIETTRARDQKNIRKLRREYWRVLRIWEHQVERDPDDCILRILNLLNNLTI